jgi:hypothetical protein
MDRIQEDKLNEKVLLNNKEITREQLREVKNNLPANQRIVETAPGNLTTVTRLQG